MEETIIIYIKGKYVQASTLSSIKSIGRSISNKKHLLFIKRAETSSNPLRNHRHKTLHSNRGQIIPSNDGTKLLK